MRTLLACLLAFLLSATSTNAQSMTADSVARVLFENWSLPSHPHVEFLKIEGVWYQLSVGADGFAALPTHAGVDAGVDALVAAILSLPVGAVQYAQPDGLDLNSLDDTATTVGHTPVDFCAQLVSVTGQYYAVCADWSSDGRLWLAVADSISHQVGWFPADDDSAVFAALAGI